MVSLRGRRGRGVPRPAGGVELLNPHNDRELTDGSDEVLLGASRQRVQNLDTVGAQEFNDSPQFPDAKLWDGCILEDEQDDVSRLDFPVLDPFRLRYEQVKSV